MEDNIVGIVPCKTDSISEGTLCIKGRTAHQFVHHKDRLRKPLIRRNGRFIETGWENALKYISEKLRDIKKKYSADAVGFLSSAKCTNEENYIIMKFARAVIGTNNVDHCARLCHASTVVGLTNSFGSGAMTNTIQEFEHADCIMVIGSNTLECHPIIGTRILRAKEKGAKLIVIDPRETPLSRFADYYLKLKPSTDIAMLNGMMNVIISNNLHDNKFIESRTENFEAFKETVKEYTPERVQRITGIPKEQLVASACAYATSNRSMIVYSMGITQHVTGTDNVMSIANLSLLTGNVGREFTGVNPLRGQNNVQGACDMGALPHFYSGYQSIADETIRKKFETAWKTTLPSNPGLTLVEMMNAAHDNRLKSLYVIGENPMLSDPDINHTREALKGLEFLVVQDIFLNETAELADVVLPATTFAEKEGTFTSTDRRVQRVRKTIEPIGDSRPDWIIISELARMMGSNAFNYSSPSEIMQEISDLTPIYGGISHERLDRGEVLHWPCLDPKHPGTKYLHKDRFAGGRGKFHPIEYREVAELPDSDYPYILTTGRIMFHYHTGTMTRKTELLSSEVTTGYMEINPRDAAKLNIRSGEKVEVRSRRGRIVINALVTERVGEGVVFIPFHFAECAANILTSATLDPKAKIPGLKVCAVNFSKVKSNGVKNEGRRPN